MFIVVIMTSQAVRHDLASQSPRGAGIYPSASRVPEAPAALRIPSGP